MKPLHAMKISLAIATLVAMSGALSAKQLIVTNPAAGTPVPIGTRCAIGWSATNLTDQTAKIEVSMSGQRDNQTVANLVLVEAGQYQWDIPWEVTPAALCKVVITTFEGTNQVGRTEGPEFSIVSNSAPTLLVRSPAGGEAWPRGTTRSVSWEPHNLSGTLTLDLLQGPTVLDSITGLAVGSNHCHYTLPAGLPTGSNYTIRLTSAFAPSASATSKSFQVTDQPPPRRKWTVLIYLDADCSMMETDAIENMVDLGQLRGSTNVNYLVQLDRAPAYVTNYGNWYDTKRFVVRPGMEPTPEYAAQHPGELNMSSPETLTDFINWATENFPAENYFLIPTDHGSGWSQGLIIDESNGGHNMTLRQLRQALDAADTHMTIVGLDMCLMGEAEVAYEIRNTGAQLLIASQFAETRNWPYLTVFQQLEAKLATLTPEALAIIVCDGFVRQYSDPTVNATLGVTRLHKMDALTAAIASFADEMATNFANQAAVRQKAVATKAAFHDAVPYCSRSEILSWQVYGQNINFPTDPERPEYINYSRALTDFAGDSHWKAFLTAYLTSLTNSWISTARELVNPPAATTVDLFRFLEAIKPEPTNAWVTFLSVGRGDTIPLNNVNVPLLKGQVIPIVAKGFVQSGGIGPTTNHFVCWSTSGDVRMGGSFLDATNTVIVNGDGLVMAFFAEDKESYDVTFTTEGNGSLRTASTSATNIIAETVNAGGNCHTITAVADPGYTFAGWGGDYPATANPFTLTNVQADMTVIAYFWPARPALSIERQPSAVTLTWPAWPPGYILEATGNLLAVPWEPVPGVTTNRAVLPLRPTNQFFRLNLPTDGWHSPYPYRFF